MEKDRFRFARVRQTLGLLLIAAFIAATGSAAFAGTLTNLSPTGASPGISVKVNGSGFDPAAANNQIQLTPPSGAPVTVAPTAIAVVDAARGIRQLTFRVPAGIAPGAAAIKVTNTVTGETSEGIALQVVELSVVEPTPAAAARGTTGRVVRINGTPNAQFTAANSKVTFGAGITITSTVVDSPTSLRATIDVAANATLGTRSIAISTPTQLLSLTNGFQVTDTAPPPDTTAPFVTLNAPSQALAGAQVTITALATDNVGIASVQFLVNDANPTDDTAAPYERVLLIPANAAPGTVFTVKAIARDQAGNTGAGEATIAVVAAPDTTNPTVVLNAPPHASPSATVQLSATAEDNVAVASVTFLANNQPIATIAQPPYQTAYVIPADAPVGSKIQIVARATDTSGHIAEDAAEVTVVQAPDTTAPTVELSAPARIGAGRTLSVSAIAADNTGVAAVHFYVDDVLIDSDTQAPYDASFPVPASAAPNSALNVRARAVDFAGLEAIDTASVTVLGNQAPTANAGGPYTVQAGDLLTFNGAASTDPDGDALTYSWNFGGGSGGGNDTGVGPSPSHAYNTAGSFKATLTVSDGRGATATAEADVTVTQVADRGAPAITLTGPSRVLPGAQVIVTAQVTDNVGVTEVAFTVNDADPTSATAAPFTRVVTVPAIAAPNSTLVVKGIAKDAAGNQTPAQLTLTVTASPDTTAPTAAMRLPQRTAPSATIIVGATAIDDSGVASVTFFAGDVPIGSDDSAPYEVTWTVPANAAPNTPLVFKARAVDFSGNAGDAQGTVQVVDNRDTTNPAVSLTAPATVAAGGTLPITANATDEGGVSAVEFFVDGVRIATDATAPYQVDYALPATRLPGSLVRLQARAIDFAGLEATASGESRVTAAGKGVIVGEAFDAITGLPLAGATITLHGDDAQGQPYTASATSDQHGRYLLRADEGQGWLRIAKAEWTTVMRFIKVTTGQAAQAIDARLTPLAPAGAPIQPINGGTLAQDGHEATVPGGAISQPTTLRLTPIDGQALATLLPAGWSPLAAMDLRKDPAPGSMTFGMPVAIRAPQSRPLALATEVLLARFDEQTNTWRAVAVVPITGDGRTIAGEIASTGQYAWLLPDMAPLAPTMPAAGLEVPGVERAPLPETLETLVNPQPTVLFYQPGVRSIVTGSIFRPDAISSGVILRSRVSEDYTFFSGAQARPESYAADVVLYQTEVEGKKLAASYPVTPSLPFEALTLKQGVIGVELYAPLASELQLPLIGSEGGSATSATGERLELPPGATTEPTPIEIQRLAAAQLGLTLPQGIAFAGGVTLGFDAELAQAGVVSIARPTDLPAGSRVLFASVAEIDGETRFVLAGIGRIAGDRLVSDSVVPGAPVALGGVRRAGRYVFLRVTSPIAFFTGLVTGVTTPAQPQANALVTSNKLPMIVSRSAVDGRYLAAVLTGANTLTARDLIKKDTGSAEGTIADAWSVATLPLQLAAQRPSVTSVSPGANALDVPLSTPIVVKFSESIAPASVTSGGNGSSGARIALNGPAPKTGGGIGPLVAASLAISGNDTTVTLRPNAALEQDGKYTVSVDGAITDVSGYPLVSALTSTFDTLDTSAPPPPPAGTITARIPVNGKTTVCVGPGTLAPGDIATVVNKRPGVPSVPVKPEANGSFCVDITAAFNDKLEIRIVDRAGNVTIVPVGRFENQDGRVVVTAEGGTIDKTDAQGRVLRLTVSPGTFPDGATVKFTPLVENDVKPTVPVGNDYPFVGAFEIDSSVAPQRYMNVSFPKPAGMDSRTTGIVAEVVQVYGQRALSIVDTAKVIGDRLATSSPPCPGLLNKFGRYAMFLNEQEQMKFGIALLSMTLPRMAPVVLAPFVVTNPFLPYPPTILHPGLQFEQQYNPATPFIHTIQQGEGLEQTAGVLAYADSMPVCFPVPPDTLMKVVARDSRTGELIQGVSQTSPGVGQIATLTSLHVAPGDIMSPKVLWTSWSPKAPYTLDLGKPIKVTFDEPVTIGAPAGLPAISLVNQETGNTLEVQTHISDGGRTITFIPQGALSMGSEFMLRMPGVRDLSGNAFVGGLTFRTFAPALVLPTITTLGWTHFNRTDILHDFNLQGITVPNRIDTVGLNDLEFYTRSPEESVSGKWETTLYAIGAGRQFGFSMLTIDASDARKPTPRGFLPGGERSYNRMTIVRDMGLIWRTLPQGDSREPLVAAWRTRQLHYVTDDMSQRVCAAPGDPVIDRWKAIQIAAGRSLSMKLSCGTLGLVTSHNTHYSILHLYDMTNPVAPVLMGQRLLSDGGALSSYPRKPEAPEATGAARGIGLMFGVDFTHTPYVGQQGQPWTHEDAVAAFVAVFGSGVTAVDLGLNAPDLDFRDRPGAGAPTTANVIESLQHYTFPYYQDVRTLRNNVLAIANDQWDGTGVQLLEVFNAGLQPIGTPLPLPVNPFEMTAVETLLRFDEDDNGTPEDHDFAFITGKQGLVMVEVKPDGAAQLAGFVPMPNAPRADQGAEVAGVQDSCPAINFTLSGVRVWADASTVYQRGTCEDIVAGARVAAVASPHPNPQNPSDNRMLATEIRFLERPGLPLVDSMRHVEIDRAAKLAYVSASWKKFDVMYEGFVVIDIAIPYGGFTDRDNDGWDDRIRGFIPVTGGALPIRAGRVNGFRFDPRRKLIYAAIDGEPNDYDEHALAIVRTCECGELEASVTLESGGAGTSPNRPSPDGTTTTIYVTPEMLSSGQFRALFDIDSYTGGSVNYTVTEFPITGDNADRLLNLDSGATGTLSSGSRAINLGLLPAGADPRGSVVAIDFTDADGNFLKRAILNLVPTNVVAGDVKVRTFIDRTNQEIYETPSYLMFALNHDAKVTIRIDGQVITPPGDGQTPGTPFVDVPLPAGLNRVLITRPMVSVPGEHDYQIQVTYEEGVTAVQAGKAIHDVVIDESLPVGHTFIKGVDLSDGHLAVTREDLTLATTGPALQFSRTYSSIGNRSGGPMGAGWSHNWLSRLEIDAYGRISISGGEGSGMRFSQANGDPAFPGARVFKPQAGYHGQLVYTGGAYDYYTKARSRYHYELAPGQQGDPDYRLTFIEDATGNRLTVTYTDQLVSKVTDATGRTLTFTYEPKGKPVEPRIVKLEGPMNLVVTFEYDELGNLVKASRDERVEQYAYTIDDSRDRHNLTRVTDPNGRFTDYTYYTQGDAFPGEQPNFEWGQSILKIPMKYELVKKVTDGAGTSDAGVTTFAFDYTQHGTKYLATVTDPRDVATKYTMNARGAVSEIRVLAGAGGGSDNVTKMTWAFEEGINDVYMTRKEEPNGRVVRYEYDARGNMTREVIEATVNGYAPVTTAAGQTAAEVITTWEYEPKFNKPVKKTDPEGHVTEYAIDPDNGNVLKLTTNPGGSAPPIVIEHTYGDFPAQGGTLRGLLKTTKDGRGHTTTYSTYDDRGNPTRIEDAEGNVTTQVFDVRGRMTEVSDTLGHRIVTEFDTLDRTTKVTRFALNQPATAGMASPDSVTATTYFPGGQKKVVTDGLGHETELAYDAQNRVRTQTERFDDGEGHQVSLQQSWQYDGAGNRLVEVDRRGIERRFTYDFMGRQRKVEVIAGASSGGGGGAKTISETEYDSVGNVVADVDLHGHRTSYDFDALYRRVKVHLAQDPYVITMAYDLNGNELSVSDANGKVTRRTYDGVNRRITQTDPLGGVMRYTYDAANNVVTETNDRTGLVRTHGPFDKLNRPLGSKVTFTDPVSQQQVTYTTSAQFLDAEHAIVTTNPRGFKVKEVLNGHDKTISRTVDPDGLALTTTYKYDENGNQVASQDSEGGEPDVVRTFDGLNRKVKSEYPLGGVERTFFDGNDNVIRTVDRRGIEMKHEYDLLDRKTADILVESISNGGAELTVMTKSYDDAGMRTITTDAKGQPTTVEFDAMHRETKSIDAMTGALRTTWDGVNKRTVTTPRGLKQEFTYDAMNRLIGVRELDLDGSERSVMSTEYQDAALRQIETDRRGAKRTMQFDHVQRLRRVSKSHPDLASAYGAAEIVMEEARFDGNGNIVERLDANGHVTRNVFDAADRLTSVTEAFGAGADIAATTVMTYDKANNLLTVKDGRAHGGDVDARYSYDARNRRITTTDGEGKVTTVTYNQNNQIETATEPRGQAWITRYSYDEIGKLLAVDETRGGVGGVTRYRYDANRNKTAQQDASGNLTTYAHDALDRVTDMREHTAAGTLGDTVMRDSSPGGDDATALHWHYDYDADNNETLIVDAEGQRVTKAYDYLNRLVRKDYANHKPAADGSVIYPQLVSVQSTPDANGNTTRVEEVKRKDASTTVTEVTVMTYDPLNRLTSRTNPDNRTIAYRYDKQGNRASVIDADDIRTTYTYDARNRVRTATTEGNQVTTYEYWPDNLPKKTTYANGLVSENTYDRDDRVKTIVSRNGSASSPISRHDYEYDENGNTKSLTESHSKLDGGQAQQTTYDYDNLNRLTGVHYPGNASVAYTLALNGNRLTEVGTNPGTQAAVNREYAYNRVNQLTKIVDHADAAASMTFVYDRNGNTREQRTGTLAGDVIGAPAAIKRFDFDIRDKLAAVVTGGADTTSASGGGAAAAGAERTTFEYDYTGLRTRKHGVVSIGYLYDDGALLQEYDPASGATLLKYNYGAGLLSMVTPGAGGRQSLFYSRDGQTSTSELTDGSGNVQASYAYDAFGALRRSTDATPNRRRYTGQYDDTDTGLQYFGARYYDPSTGRFLSQDAYGGSEDAPPSLHRYAYAHGNPLTFGDPTGYSVETFKDTMRDLGAWSKGLANGAFKALGAPVAGLLESGVKGLADITMAGVGMLTIEAMGGKYVDEIGNLLQPVSTIGQAAAEKGTIAAVRESATGFLLDSVKGVVTMPARVAQASLSGDPELLGETLMDAGQNLAGLKTPIAKAIAPGVRVAERAAIRDAIMRRERISKRGTIAGKEVKAVGAITASDAWELAGRCVEKGAHGCGFVGGLMNESDANFARNKQARTSLGRGEIRMNDAGDPVKFQGDVDFMVYRKDSLVMNNASMADQINNRTSRPLLDEFPEHGVLGEYMPPSMIPMEVKQLWWKQRNLPEGSPIRAYDYMRKGVEIPPGMKLYDGNGKLLDPQGKRHSFINKPNKPGVTMRKLEPHAFEFSNGVHVLDEMPWYPVLPDAIGMSLRYRALENEYEKGRAK